MRLTLMPSMYLETRLSVMELLPPLAEGLLVFPVTKIGHLRPCSPSCCAHKRPAEEEFREDLERGCLRMGLELHLSPIQAVAT